MGNFPPSARSRPFVFVPKLLEFLACVTWKRASAENFVGEITKISSTFVIFFWKRRRAFVYTHNTRARTRIATVSRWKWQLAGDSVVITDIGLSRKFVNKSLLYEIARDRWDTGGEEARRFSVIRRADFTPSLKRRETPGRSWKFWPRKREREYICICI